MSIDEIRAHCLSKKLVTEDLPFGEDTLVFRVADKIFLLTGLNAETVSINVKCDPERAINLRESHADVKPGYHMNKKHWNKVDCEGALSKAVIKELIDHSYDLVVADLPSSIRKDLFL
jgi:predicted DNA-binding protein (MmcQ/YjbR family)